MAQAFEIPLQPSTPQKLAVSILNVQYNLNIWWNDMDTVWYLDIADLSGKVIVSGIPMVTSGDLLEQYPDLDFGFQLIVFSDHDPTEIPQFNTLGTTAHLYVITP